MVTNAFIKLWGNRVGAVIWDESLSLASFEFDPNFLKLGLDVSPVMMSIHSPQRIFQFKDLSRTSTFKGLPGLLADVMPDKYGNALINSWLLKQGRLPDSLNPVEILCFIGNRGMGALEFEPIRPDILNQSEQIHVEELVHVAGLLLSGKTAFVTNMSKHEEKAMYDVLKIGTSAGGARAKALVAFNEETGEIRSGQTFVPEGYEHWLLKFDGVSDAQFGATFGYGRVEMAYYLMAQSAGLTMMESRLLEENGRAHFMTKRFDRNPQNEKIHVQTFCAMRHFDFNEVNVFSYEELFMTMRMLGLSYPEAQEMFRRMVFNVMSRNCDDHTKNFAFMMDQSGNWSLAPAYDVCHAYRPGSAWVSQHALSVNGKRMNITREDLMMVARQMNIKNAHEIIDQVAASCENWIRFAKDAGVEAALKNAIRKTHVIL
jgi:serine/threonine-protein kinase HipA